jgi:hypothetical protein
MQPQHPLRWENLVLGNTKKLICVHSQHPAKRFDIGIAMTATTQLIL